MGEDSQLATIQNTFCSLVAEETGEKPEAINVDDTFHALGLDSVTGVFVMERLERKFQISLTPLDFWDYPTIRSFSEYIQTKLDDR